MQSERIEGMEAETTTSCMNCVKCSGKKMKRKQFQWKMKRRNKKNKRIWLYLSRLYIGPIGWWYGGTIGSTGLKWFQKTKNTHVTNNNEAKITTMQTTNSKSSFFFGINESYLKPTCGRAYSDNCRRAGVSVYGLMSGLLSLACCACCWATAACCWAAAACCCWCWCCAATACCWAAACCCCCCWAWAWACAWAWCCKEAIIHCWKFVLVLDDQDWNLINKSD